MPWQITSNDPACPAGRPWSVRLESTGRLEGCHPTEAEAQAQVAALHAAEVAVRVAVVLAAGEFQTLDDLDLVPTSGMVTEAQRGLDWRDELERGGTSVGIARARDIVNRKRLSPSTVKRMSSFFARHEVDKRAEGFRPGEDGYPSNGRIAWALWGGDAGKRWADVRVRQIERIEEGT